MDFYAAIQDISDRIMSGAWGEYSCIYSETMESMSGVLYAHDDDGNAYALISLGLPNGVYAEIDGGTYGTLQGIRIYGDWNE